MERLLDDKEIHILRETLCGMKRRCNNPEDKSYKDYGGRGIEVCTEWMDKKCGHKNFQRWAINSGWKRGLSIDRINNNGNYEPSNCRWATAKEQANNRRTNLYVTIHGVTKTAQEWADEIGIKERSFVSRINSGWSEERLLEPKYKPLKMSKGEMSAEIRKWRRLEEQGRLIKLPCKEAYTESGGIVYLIYDDEVVECTHCGLGINPVDGKAYITLATDEDIFPYRRPIPEYDLDHTDWCTNINYVEVGEVEKTVFLTKSEAKSKLKELMGDEQWAKD